MCSANSGQDWGLGLICKAVYKREKDKLGVILFFPFILYL